jgi:uncharacterized protein (TIGR00297 family)
MSDCKSPCAAPAPRCPPSWNKPAWAKAATGDNNDDMTGTALALRTKAVREKRLRWQSHLLLVLVSLTAAVGLVQTVASARTPATTEGLVICAAFGVLVWLLHAATPLAAATGFLLTSCLYLRTMDRPDGGWFHTALLPGLALFVLAFAATRFGRSRKERSGLAESRRGRSASQVAANMGAAALAALALPPPLFAAFHVHGWTFTGPIFFAPAIAALAGAAADTVSSEIGQAVGGLPWLITSRQRVPTGTDGAVSLAGTAAGMLAAAIVVLAAVPTLRLDARQAAIAWSSAIVGLFADTLIGATLERRGRLNNDAVNFLSTAIAAFAAAFWLLLL